MDPIEKRGGNLTLAYSAQLTKYLTFKELCFGFLCFILLQIISKGIMYAKKDRHTVIAGVFQKYKDTDG